jgi:16S rRNA (guanine527-N7)-methyltransferase
VTDHPSRTLPGVPAVATSVFGDRLALAERFAEQLAGPGLDHGLMGPRELPRLWDRHLLNCAVVTDLLPVGATVVDVGSGAGLPGLVLAIRRADLHVVCVESMARRTEFLMRTADVLGLESQISVKRGRIEDAAVQYELGAVDWMTARAVAPLDRLVGWCLPALRPAGELLALKGATAAAELAEHGKVLTQLGAGETGVVECGVGLLPEPTRVVRVTRRMRLPTTSKGRA